MFYPFRVERFDLDHLSSMNTVSLCQGRPSSQRYSGESGKDGIKNETYCDKSCS